MAVKFKRVAAVFEEAVLERRPCESSGSEHSPEESSDEDLSDLVNSFIEKGIREINRDRDVIDHEKERNENESESYCSDSDMKDMLLSLIRSEEDDDDDDDDVAENIRAETEKAFGSMGNGSVGSGFKRRLMTRLRDRGFDAGLCKSKWERNGRLPSGDYEYIDINISGTRYIIEVFLGSEFQIARPTNNYTSLIQIFPQIFVGKVEKLKKIVRLMCNAMKESMKCNEMDVPPWRRFGYMKAKWFGSYKRTINESTAKKSSVDEDPTRKRSVGFKPLPGISYYCREDFATKVGLKEGLLAMAFKDTTML